MAGGADASHSLRSLEVFDFRTRRWRRGPSFPVRRATTRPAWPPAGSFYVLAGRDASNLAVAERYDPRRRRWERLPQPARRARRDRLGARVGGRIVVFGGENLEPGGTTIAPVELYDIA